MALLLKVDVNEDIQSLKRLCKQAPAAFKPRIKMLQLMKQGISALPKNSRTGQKPQPIVSLSGRSAIGRVVSRH